jgi:hypothetical protein
MTKFQHMRADIPNVEIVERDPTPWLLLVPIVALDVLLFVSVHLDESLRQLVLYALSHLLIIR